LPTKMIADKEIIVESGPPPEIPEKKIEKMTEELDNESKQIDHESKQKSSNKSKRMHEFPISFKLDWS